MFVVKVIWNNLNQKGNYGFYKEHFKLLPLKSDVCLNQNAKQRFTDNTRLNSVNGTQTSLPLTRSVDSHGNPYECPNPLDVLEQSNT